MPIDFDYASCTRAIGDDAPEMLLDRPGMNADAGEVVPLPGNNFSVSDCGLDEQIERYKKLIQMNLNLNDNSNKLQMRLEALLTEKARRSRAPKTRTLQQLDKFFQQTEEPGRVYFEPGDASKCDTPVPLPRISKENEAIQQRKAGANALRFHCFKRRKLSTRQYETSDSEKDSESAAKAQIVTSAPRTRASRRAEALTGGTPDSAVVLFSSDDESAEYREPTAVSAGDGPARRTSSRISMQRMRDQSFKIAFPSRDDPDAVEVYYQDLNHLKPAEFLNDTVIDFYIKYLQNTGFEDSEKRRDCFYFYNSFFFKKLGEAMDLEDKQKQAEALSKLRKWTRGVDIFQMSYLLIPINAKFHWSLAIVGFSSSGDEQSVVPYIYHLDSLESGHQSKIIFRSLQRYLEMEHEHTRNSCRVAWKSTVTRRVDVPRQDNEYDCGLFLLYYIKRFIAEAPLPCKLSDVTLFGRRWFRPMEASGLRAIIRELLLKLFDES